MNLIVVDDYVALSRAAADLVADFVRAKPDAVLVFPTGNTPLGLYKELAARRQAGTFDGAQLRVFLLDEYWGIAADDPRSLYAWLVQACLEPLGIPTANVVRLPTQAADVAAACRAYDQRLAAAGGLDLAILGLGPNGHIGYNDPPAAGDAPTRLLTLTESSLAGAVSYFGGRDRVPPQAITCGMKQLLAARQTLLIVNGAHKQEILRQSLRGSITPEVPASYLQQAANVTVIVDQAAWPAPTAK
jgi:glucosamine-6-phosphate deaminase